MFPGGRRPLRRLLAGRAARPRPSGPRGHSGLPGAQRNAPLGVPLDPVPSLGSTPSPGLAPRQPSAPVSPLPPEERGDRTYKPGLGAAPGLSVVRHPPPATPLLCHALHGHLFLVPRGRRRTRIPLGLTSGASGMSNIELFTYIMSHQ